MLKRLELVGFKSFADKTQFDFPSGLTAIVGPNGSGKCVTGDTMVTLADGRDVPIRELVEAALKQAPTVQTLDDGVLTLENPCQVRVLSLNPQTLRLEPRPVAAFVKREAPPTLLRIQTRVGREVTATPYHPLFTLEKGQLRALKAEEIREGIRIALPRQLPTEKATIPLSQWEALQNFEEEDNLYVPNSPALKQWASQARTRFGTWKEWRQTAQVSETQLRGFLEGQAIHTTALARLGNACGVEPSLDGHFKCSNTSVQMCLPSEFTPELARFLGLFIAEGRSTASNQVWFVNSEEVLTEEFQKLARLLFDLNARRNYYKSSAEDCLIFSRALQLVLERLFRFRTCSRSADKEAPPQVFQADDEVKWAFLSGLFEGDAYVCVRTGRAQRQQVYIEYSTASEKLARQVVAILLRLNVFAQLRSAEKYASNTKEKRRRTYYSVFIYGIESLRFVARQIKFAGKKKDTLRALLNLALTPNPNLDIVPGVTPLVKEAVRLAGAKLKPHRRDCPKLLAYVENRCEASRGGLLEVAGRIEEWGATPEVARDKLDRLRLLATSDIFWDEVVSVEQVPPPDDWVYDLCIAETHNFVAGNIIVHNSNVVDAVRWILGEQSAKSLRGGEMADVIFNGSTSRRSFGMAEVTMTFDNRRKQLATEEEEVQITRRVYRNGEGEYLINQQPSRLKDIKQLFLGSGAGTDAYCIIEQGRVDVMLQASTKERRTIFEEAAGISRFKAKKIETLRKLERVDLDLQRLKDIIEEVEKQLRSVKLQASKAQRYQEHTQRLRELRVGLGLEEYHQFAERLQTETATLDGLRANLDQQAQQAESWEAETRRLEESVTQLDQSVHGQESLLASARQQIASEEATLSHEGSLSADLETDLRQTRTRLTELSSRVASLAEATARAGDELHTVASQCQDQQRGAQRMEEELAGVLRRLEELHQQVEADKDEHLEQMRQAARLQNDVVSYKAQLDNLRREHDRLRLKTEQAAEHLASLDLEVQDLARAEEALQGRLVQARQALAEQRQERERLRQQSESTQQKAADLRAQRSGLASRIEVLEGLERSHEGLTTGVREVFALLEQKDATPWGTVCGMLADLLTVPREHAPLIDLALGERAQSFLVRDASLLDEALRQRSQPFSGRVSFLPIHTIRRESEPLTALPGAIAFAEQLVTCNHPELSDLPAQLLQRTLLVPDLATARTIAATRGDYRFVTLQGELLERDGTLTIGTHHAEMGLLSRKSELRELRVQVDELDCRQLETEGELIDLRERMATLDARVEEAQKEIEVLAEQTADLHSRLLQRQDRREGLHEEVSVSRTEITGIEQEIQRLEEAWQKARAEVEAAEQRVQMLQTRLHQAEQEKREREQLQQQRQRDCTAARVALAQAEERLAAIEARHQQLECDLDQRQQERLQTEQHLVGVRNRLRECQRLMLAASSALANGYLDKEAAEHRLADLNAQREQQRQQRQALLEQVQTARGAWRGLQEQAHARELEVNDLQHRRDTLVDRLREDYQIELAELYQLQRKRQSVESAEGVVPPESLPSDPPSSLDPAVVNQEIAELRRKIDRLGSVNLDALQELAELETRAQSLRAQFEDLTSAQRSLQEIIGRINQDSRRLFSETLATIRTHFQELFRKLFGGGMADIVLEDENDILESGIEVVARPPGKELRSISLMSGGEKTLTAVALLLAIFRSKPSPFCILDEVDAALDEANIGRFTGVLREFLDMSQFIIITHSKRTMTSADVLYGITMQESGISKRVAVRFEDWPDDGADSPAEPAAATRNGDNPHE